jgi:hypothetical protein
LQLLVVFWSIFDDFQFRNFCKRSWNYSVKKYWKNRFFNFEKTCLAHCPYLPTFCDFFGSDLVEIPLLSRGNPATQKKSISGNEGRESAKMCRFWSFLTILTEKWSHDLFIPGPGNRTDRLLIDFAKPWILQQFQGGKMGSISGIRQFLPNLILNPKISDLGNIFANLVKFLRKRWEKLFLVMVGAFL